MKTLLDGLICAYIDRAEDLPNTDSSKFNISGSDLTDPYVTGQLGPMVLFKTKVINNTLNPSWKEKFSVLICQESENIKIKVRDKDQFSSTRVGSVTFACEDLLDGKEIEGWFDLLKKQKSVGRLKMSIQFIPKDKTNKPSEVWHYVNY